VDPRLFHVYGLAVGHAELRWGVRLASKRQTPDHDRALWSVIYLLRAAGEASDEQIAKMLALDKGQVAAVLRRVVNTAMADGWWPWLWSTAALIRESVRVGGGQNA
jgi:hypothetical protein